jgi:hypothetical protein
LHATRVRDHSIHMSMKNPTAELGVSSRTAHFEMIPHAIMAKRAHRACDSDVIPHDVRMAIASTNMALIVGITRLLN